MNSLFYIDAISKTEKIIVFPFKLKKKHLYVTIRNRIEILK